MQKVSAKRIETEFLICCYLKIKSFNEAICTAETFIWDEVYISEKTVYGFV